MKEVTGPIFLHFSILSHLSFSCSPTSASPKHVYV